MNIKKKRGGGGLSVWIWANFPLLHIGLTHEWETDFKVKYLDLEFNAMHSNWAIHCLSKAQRLWALSVFGRREFQANEEQAKGPVAGVEWVTGKAQTVVQRNPRSPVSQGLAAIVKTDFPLGEVA